MPGDRVLTHRHSLSLESQVAILERTVEALRARVRELSRDELTGAWGRHHLNRLLAAECMRARRYGRPAGVLVVDVDGLKRLNDQHGHPAGDEALAGVARILRACLRGHDVVVRTGGDEFVIAVDDARRHALLRLAKRIVDAVFASHLGVTVSVGAAKIDRDERPSNALELADRLMYDAKRAGGNAAIGLGFVLGGRP